MSIMRATVSTWSIAGANKSQIQASILKDQEITVARIGQATLYCGHPTFNTKK